MPPIERSHVFQGSCHCGELALAFATRVRAEALLPRACDCGFCRKHGASWVSDPHGRLRIATAGAAPLRYRQGSREACFLLCPRCGVLVVVIHEDAGRVYGAVNAACLDDVARLGASVEVSPRLLAPDAKVARWRQAWIPEVELPSGPERPREPEAHRGAE